MGQFKQMQIEQQEREAILCEICQKRIRKFRCLRCGELTICRSCHENGHSPMCGYCEYISNKDD